MPPTSRESDTGLALATADWPARVPLRQAALAQIGAVLVLWGMVLVLGRASFDVMTLALIQGFIAAILGRYLGLDWWWIPIHALFAPGLLWTQTFGLPPVYALSAFCLLASLYWTVSRTRVPLFLSSRDATRSVADVLPRDRSFTFLDMGCGLGGVLSSLARTRPLGQYHGIESAPLPFLVSRLRAITGSGRLCITWGDYDELDLSRYDVVYAYLSPAAMSEVWRKASSEMRPGSLLISNSFAVPGVAPGVTIPSCAHDGSKLLLWQM